MATQLFGNQTYTYQDEGIEPFWSEDGAFEEEEPEGDPPPGNEPPDDPKEAGFLEGMKAERAKRQAAEARIAELEAADAERSRKAAEEAGQFQDLYKQTQSEAEKLRAEVEQYRAAETARIERVEARNTAALEKLPEPFRALVPEGLSPDAVSEQIQRLAALAQQDAGPAGSRAGAGKPPKEAIPPECIAQAKQHGKDPEFWFENVWKPRQSRKSQP